jgi:hypothetical protein
VEWIVRFARFHGMRSREDLFPAEPKIKAFLTDLAVNRHVAAATQNQAMNALVFLYKRVLNLAMEAESAGFGSGAWRGLPAPCASPEVSACC